MLSVYVCVRAIASAGEHALPAMCACVRACVPGFEQGGVSPLLATPFAVAAPL